VAPRAWLLNLPNHSPDRPADRPFRLRLGTAALVVLALALPFEPRVAWRAGPVGLTLLEGVAALAMAALAIAGRSCLLSLLRRPPWPLVAITALAAAHLLSALCAPEANAAAARFALRMAAMAALAWLVASAEPSARRLGLVALVVSGAAVALLAVGEGLGLRSLDTFLGLFREMPFNVAGARRASGGSEYPNQAAAILMYALLAAAGLSTGRPRALSLLLPAALLFAAGMLFTYSRGALVAAALGLAAQWMAARTLSATRPSAPLLALGILVLAAVAFGYGGEVFRLRLESEGTVRWYGARYEPADAALALRPSESRRVDVRVTNTGRKSWTRDEAFHLSYHWLDQDKSTLADGARTALPRALGSGESVLLRAEVKAPREEGRYLLVWDMVHEHTTWFSGQGVDVAAVPVAVSASGDTLPPAGPAVPAPTLTWSPSRLELWRLALGMWAERPLTGMGSDRFRWLYGPRAGRRFWDARVYANNTLLETAATTGTLGAAALLLTLLSSGLALVAGLRAVCPSSEAAAGLALLGLVAGIFAHGVVDYVLAFTGHYLLLGFVVGSCAAFAREAASP
jgi:hypothetical protein